MGKLVLSSILITFFCFACNSKKKIVNTNVKPTIRNTGKIMDSIVKHLFSPTSFASKLTVEIKTPDEERSFKTSVKVRTDSAISLLISKAGLTAATALVTVDTVYVKQKLPNDTCFTTSLDLLSKELNTDLDFKLLQDLIFANPIGFDKDDKYKSPKDTAFYYLTNTGKRIIRRLKRDKEIKKDYICQYWFYANTFKPYKINIYEVTDTSSLTITYPEYEVVDNHIVPLRCEITAQKGKNRIELFLKYTRTRINQKEEFLKIKCNAQE